jgi:hypothetical protein
VNLKWVDGTQVSGDQETEGTRSLEPVRNIVST